MDPCNAQKTVFWTLVSNFHYTMPFALKNAGATYQFVMIAIFHDMVHDCVKDYTNDIAVRSHEVIQHIDGLRKVLLRWKHYSVRMNSLKCLWCLFWKILGFRKKGRSLIFLSKRRKIGAKKQCFA